MSSDNKQQLVIVVAGIPVTLEGNVNAPVQSLIGKALAESGNAGQPEQNWELRDTAGVPVDAHKRIGDFAAGTKLFLNQKVGVGG